jgi:peptidylprolyl isomerase
MAQTGDVEFGTGDDLRRAGTGGANLPDLPAEFSDVPFERGVIGMARSSDPDSANSQFFIMFAPAPHLNGQYTVVGRVIEGMDVVDAIAKGEPPASPDRMASVSVLPGS